VDKRVIVSALVSVAASCVALSAQTVTVTRPGADPIVVPCAPSCAVAFTPAVVEPPPPPPPPACLYTVAPTSLTFTPDGGTQVVAVMVTPDPAQCPAWGTSGSNDWLTLDPIPASEGVGVRVTAAGGARVARSATLTIAGHQVTVTQGAAPEPPPPPPPTGTVLSRLACTSANFPHCGIGYWGRETGTAGVYQGHTVTQVGNGARFRLTPGSSQAQFYLGWQLPTQNTSAGAIYIRFHLTMHAPFNASGVGDIWTDKLIIVNNGGSTRAIGELKPVRTSTDVTIGIQKNIEGGTTLTTRQDLAIGRRYAVQMRVARGSAVRFATCLDQPVEASCVQSGTFSFNVASFQNVGIGFYSNATIAANGNVDFTIENAEVGTSFDPNFR
jgi:hypothetical protein